ncbi:MAG TPA: hypothetical protein VGS41_17645 [Chthonomonadales bacterium]|nr:hypothetical protein [Chthonomonadales bacterium]
MRAGAARRDVNQTQLYGRPAVCLVTNSTIATSNAAIRPITAIQPATHIQHPAIIGVSLSVAAVMFCAAVVQG